MARKSKKEKLGNYVKKIGYFDLYQKFTYNRSGKVESSAYRLVHAKNVIQDKFKNVFTAEQSASALIKDKVKYDKHNKS